MTEIPVACCKCKQIPEVKKEVGDLWYISCGCSKWNKYEFLGTTSQNAIRNWNFSNASSRKYINKNKREE